MGIIQDLLKTKTFVVLDTCVLRDMAYTKTDYEKIFIEMKNDGYEFCAADHAFGELLNQFKNEKFTSDDYRKIIKKTSKFISSELPLFPGKMEIFGLVGCNIPGFNEKDTISFSKNAWQKTQEIRRSRDIKKDIESILQKDRDVWINNILNFKNMIEESIDKNQNISHKEESGENVLEKMLDAVKNDIDSKLSCVPALSIRLDAMIHHGFLKHMHSLKDKEPYNPTSDSKKNDGIDFTMGLVFMLPALLCSEKKYRNVVRQIGSFQSGWVFTASELAKDWKSGKLGKPIFPE